MKERKYKDDWVTEVSLDDQTGREKRTVIYQGEWLEMSAQEKKTILLRAGAGLGLFLACWILYFCIDFPGTRVLYVFLPLGCTVFPIAYWIMGVAALIKNPLRMTRLQREKSIGRIHRSAIGASLLSGTAVLGDLIFSFQMETFSQEMGGLILLMVALAVSVISAKTVSTANFEPGNL